MITPFKYQEPHIDNLVQVLSDKGRALDGSDLGTGKTICAVLTAQRLGLDLYVITKKAVRPTWHKWAEAGGVKLIGATNYEMARRHGIPWKSDTLYVFDEVHKCKGISTLNAKLLLSTYISNVPLLMLSGTAASNPMEMWALGQILGLHKGNRDWFRFLFAHGVRRNTNFPGMRFDGKLSHLQKIHKHIYPAFGSRMRIEEIPDFPETQITAECYETVARNDAKIAPFVKELDARMDEYYAKQAGAIAPTNSSLTEDLFDRMETELRKVPVFLSLMEDALEEGMSVAIFVNFRLTATAITNLTDRRYSFIRGGQSERERDDALCLFQADKTRVAVVMLEAGGEGLDLHDVTGKHRRLALLSPGYKAIELRQALGRVRRAGAKSKSIQKIIFGADSIEEDVCKVISAKLAQIDTINDDDLLPPPIAGLPAKKVRTKICQEQVG